MGSSVLFWSKVDKSSEGQGCWEWLGTLNPGGYGVLYGVEGFPHGRLTHRHAYEALVGAIPEGLHIDHLCRNRRCANPAHMEPVTNSENVKRGFGPSVGGANLRAARAKQAAKTHCLRGHEYVGGNVRLANRRGRPYRLCVECTRAYDRELYRKRTGTRLAG